jgi:hypothetical protein
VLVGAEARREVLLELGLHSRRLLEDDVIDPEGAGQHARHLDVVVAAAVPDGRDARLGTNARLPQLEQNVARVASPAQGQHHRPARQSPADSVPEELGVRPQSLVARDVLAIPEVPVRPDEELAVPGEARARRHGLDVLERRLVVDEEAELQEDGERFGIEIQRCPLSQERHDRRRDGELRTARVVEERIEAVAVVLDVENATVPAPAREDAVRVAGRS